jgi:hypothetical protein
VEIVNAPSGARSSGRRWPCRSLSVTLRLPVHYMYINLCHQDRLFD